MLYTIYKKLCLILPLLRVLDSHILRTKISHFLQVMSPDTAYGIKTPTI